MGVQCQCHHWDVGTLCWELRLPRSLCCLGALSCAAGERDRSIPTAPEAAPQQSSEVKHDRLFTAVSWHCRQNYPYFDTSQKLAVKSDSFSRGAAAPLRLPLTVADDRNMRA